jgi:hypothetical protein
MWATIRNFNTDTDLHVLVALVVKSDILYDCIERAEVYLSFILAFAIFMCEVYYCIIISFFFFSCSLSILNT